MAFKPLRERALQQRRLDYVRSEAIDPAEAQQRRRQGNPFAILDDIGDFLEEKLFGKSEGQVYRVELAERQDAEKISWIEKATQRDFRIGVSLGSLAFLSMMAATGGTALIAPGLLIAGGALLGGMSDYLHNNNEMSDAAYIQPAKHINRDAIKGALGWGFGIKLAITAVAVGLAAAGAPVFGLGATWAAAAGSAGVLGQVAAVMQSIPAIVGLGGFAVGASFGGLRGSEQGYKRMGTEHKAAELKSERPELGVSVMRERGLSAPDLGLTVVAPAVTAGLVAGIGSQAARMEQQDIASTASMHPAERHTPALAGSAYPKATPIAYPNEQQQARMDATTLPDMQQADMPKPVFGKHTEALMEKRAAQPSRQPIDLSGLKGVSFVDRHDQRQAETSAMPVAAL